ncbi:MAG: hypothetical protein J0L86_05625 [Flavobacteriales bacterium]|nr:hypothetical protein [Flavobacteriales bacterium]
MASNRSTLKSYFNAGDRPKESEFADLIESTLNLVDDKADNSDIDSGVSDSKFVTVLGSKRSARKSITVNGLTADLNTGNIQLPATEVPLTFGNGLTRTANSVAVNNSQNINKLSNLNTNGYVKTNAGDGTLSVSATIPATDLTGTLPSSVSLGNAVATSLNATGAITSSSGGIGYTAGNGGVVSQSGSKSTLVELNKLAGNITLNGSILNAGEIVSFTLTNSQIGANDVLFLQHQAVGTFGGYTLNGRTAAGSAIISIRNNTAASLSEAIVVRFIVIKSTIS